MNAFTAVTATVYAIALWMFAPESVWRREVEQAKRNQQNRLNPTPEQIPDTVPTPIQETTPEPIPEPVPTPETITAIVEPITEIVEPITEPIPDTQPEPDTIPTPEPETVPETIPETIPESILEPKQSKQSIQTSEGTVYTNWTTTQLRDEAKKRKLNWRPLINGKRTPLKKPDLIALLTT